MQSLRTTFSFYKKHFLVIFALGLVAGLGRVGQLGGFGQIDTSLHITLEVMIESARVFLFLYVLGFSSVSKGIARIWRFVTAKSDRKVHLKTAKQKFVRHWPSLVLNIVGYLAVAVAINYLIQLTVYETCFYLSLKQDGILNPASSEWAMLLFLKNLSVIPFTLVFDAILLLWLANKLHPRAALQ